MRCDNLRQRILASLATKYWRNKQNKPQNKRKNETYETRVKCSGVMLRITAISITDRKSQI